MRRQFRFDCAFDSSSDREWRARHRRPLGDAEDRMIHGEPRIGRRSIELVRVEESRAIAGELLEPFLAGDTRFHVVHDRGMIGLVELLIQQSREHHVARAASHRSPPVRPCQPLSDVGSAEAQKGYAPWLARASRSGRLGDLSLSFIVRIRREPPKPYTA